MPDSLIDRFFTNWSMDASGPLTRSIAEASTSGFIRDDAAHWSIEPYIPLETDSLIRYLIGRNELTASSAELFFQYYSRVHSILHEQTGSYHTRFASLYSPIDPDVDSRVPTGIQCDPSDPSPKRPQVNDTVALCEEILIEAGYRRLSQDDVEKCVGVASQFGVPLHVDFDLFDQLVVYARGDIIGTKLRRRLRKLYRPEPIEVPIYQRMVVIFKLSDDNDSEEELLASALHLRMFKNIPKQDIDMLLPGASVRITGVDHVRILVPSLGGLVLSLRKIIQFLLIFAALTLYSTAVLVGLVLAAIGYIVKSVLSYFQTKNRYLLNLTRNLYFQKLDTNAGVAYRIIQQAQRQSSLENILAYYALLTSDEPASARRVRRRCERLLREAIDVEVDFQVNRALGRLAELELLQSRAEDGRWEVARPKVSN